MNDTDVCKKQTSKQMISLRDIVHSGNHIPHILVYGHHASINKEVISSLYPNMNFHTESNDYDGWARTTYTSDYFFDYEEINLGSHSSAQIDMFMKWYITHVNKGGYFKQKIRILGFTHCEKLKPSFQYTLRRYLESYKASFIFMTTTYSHIKEPIRSRCVCIRMPQLESGSSYISPCKAIVSSCMLLYKHDHRPLTMKDLVDIKDYSVNILKYDINLSELCRVLLQEILQDVRFPHIIKYQIVSYITNWEHTIKQGYTKLIYIEELLVTIYNLLFTVHYEVDRDEQE